jgi:Lipocalin-like domain
MGRAILGAIALLGVISSLEAASAQSKSLREQLIGTWILSSVVNTDANGVQSTPWGEHPLGVVMFDEAGHFAQMIIDPDKDASTIDYFGAYSVDEADKEIVLHVIGSSARRFDGKDTKRLVESISDEDLKTHNPTPSLGSSAETVWKRAK